MEHKSRRKKTQHSCLDLDKLKKECTASAEVISQLRVRAPNASEACCIRYLLVHHNDLELAAENIDKMLIWRQITFPMTTTPYSTSSDAFYCHGYDKLGHPILFYVGGRVNIKTRNIEELTRYFIYMMEVALSRIPKTNMQVVVVIDRSVPLDSDYDFASHISYVSQKYYPALIYRIYVYPAGLVFKSVWFIMKQITSNRVAKILRPISNVEGLRNVIDDKYIPVRMGGSCTYEFNINDYPSPFAENFKLLSPGEIADDDVEEGEDLPDDLYVEESNDHESVNNRINQPSMSIYYMNSLIQEDNAHNDK